MSNPNHSSLRSGALIAASAAALVLAGCAGTGGMSSSSAKMASVHCAGVNACKGTSACKTAENACKGMNKCKGHGFLVMSAEDCAAKGGKVM